jgi:ABC-type polysaccharide/polyol phosphate transport system ATPase subunit
MERITLDKISKQFTIDAKNKTALDNAISLFSRQTKRRLRALKNISFSAKAGENIGIIGRNRSGKSTLLRVIAGIYTADSGNIKTKGKIVYLDGLEPGLKKRLTMRENIYLMGSLLGLSQKDIKNKFNAIIEFSELEEFVDTKVFQFSSGMVARFSFSATIHFVEHHNPDIILIDEVFGAGADIDFQKKSIQKMEELIKGGATVLLASHNLDLIKKYCHRAIWMDKGEIIKEGGPEEVCDAYAKSQPIASLNTRSSFLAST